MNWSLKFDEDLGIIIVVYADICNSKDFEEVAKKRIAIGKEKGIAKALIDLSWIKTDSIRNADVKDIVNHMYDQEGNQAHWMLAIITPLSPVAREQVGFLVRDCKHRGWNVDAFEQRQDALEWLLEQPSYS